MARENAGRGPASRGSVAHRAPAELLPRWACFLAVAVADAVTYARFAPDELYHVSEHVLFAGLGRALVFLNFPTAIAAIAVAPIAVDRGAPRSLAAIGVVLCALTPAFVSQANLDAKWSNVLPAVGVALTIALIVGPLEASRPLPGDRPRLVFAA